MERQQLAKYNLPDSPGVYLFKEGRKVLYVGKATSLRDRVRSYFDDDLIVTRGPRLVDVITRANALSYEATPTVLEALVREAALIREHWPIGNAEGKDDKTFLYALITDEEIPRVLAARGSNIDFGKKRYEGQRYRAIYGPFPSGQQLREGLRLIRKIFPFFDTPKPVGYKGKHQKARIEFNTQIGQYPKNLDRGAYLRNIRHVSLFLAGRTKELRHQLGQEMKVAAQEERFEDAAEARRQLFAMDHIQDVSLIKDEHRDNRLTGSGRIEAYDTAHISGTNAIGVMTVLIDGVPIKKEYRAFRIRGAKPKSGHPMSTFGQNDDVAALKEILSRRLGHPEWQLPKLIVVDGGKAQKNAAEEILEKAGVKIPIVAVVKDEKHRPREVMGAQRAGAFLPDAILANAEAHRFSLRLHRQARRRANKL